MQHARSRRPASSDRQRLRPLEPGLGTTPRVAPDDTARSGRRRGGSARGAGQTTRPSSRTCSAPATAPATFRALPPDGVGGTLATRWPQRHVTEVDLRITERSRDALPVVRHPDRGGGHAARSGGDRPPQAQLAVPVRARARVTGGAGGRCSGAAPRRPRCARRGARRLRRHTRLGEPVLSGGAVGPWTGGPSATRTPGSTSIPTTPGAPSTSRTPWSGKARWRLRSPGASTTSWCARASTDRPCTFATAAECWTAPSTACGRATTTASWRPGVAHEGAWLPESSLARTRVPGHRRSHGQGRQHLLGLGHATRDGRRSGPEPGRASRAFCSL